MSPSTPGLGAARSPKCPGLHVCPVGSILPTTKSKRTQPGGQSEGSDPTEACLVYPHVSGSALPPNALHPAKSDPQTTLLTHSLSVHSTGLTCCPLPFLGPLHMLTLLELNLCPSQGWPLTLSRSQSSHGCHYPVICTALRLPSRCFFCLLVTTSCEAGLCEGQGSKGSHGPQECLAVSGNTTHMDG